MESGTSLFHVTSDTLNAFEAGQVAFGGVDIRIQATVSSLKSVVVRMYTVRVPVLLQNGTWSMSLRKRLITSNCPERCDKTGTVCGSPRKVSVG